MFAAWLLSTVYTGEKTVHVYRYRQQWRFEKIGEFLLKSSEIARPTSLVYVPLVLVKISLFSPQ